MPPPRLRQHLLQTAADALRHFASALYSSSQPEAPPNLQEAALQLSVAEHALQYLGVDGSAAAFAAGEQAALEAVLQALKALANDNLERSGGWVQYVATVLKAWSRLLKACTGSGAQAACKHQLAACLRQHGAWRRVAAGKCSRGRFPGSIRSF